MLAVILSNTCPICLKLLNAILSFSLITSLQVLVNNKTASASEIVRSSVLHLACIHEIVL